MWTTVHATHYNTEEAFGCNQCPRELEKGEQEDDFENKREVHICDGIDMGNMQYATKVPKVPPVCIICICSLRHLTIFCQHFWRFCINIFNDSWFAGKLVEGTNCSERALLPEKSMREKLSQLIEDDFSKVTLVNTLKYFKQKSGKMSVLMQQSKSWNT